MKATTPLETEWMEFCTFLQCIDSMSLGFTEPYESGLIVRDCNGVEIVIPFEVDYEDDNAMTQERLCKAVPEGSRLVGFYAIGRGLVWSEHGVYEGLKECIDNNWIDRNFNFNASLTAKGFTK